jgi:hypothetical protein
MGTDRARRASVADPDRRRTYVGAKMVCCKKTADGQAVIADATRHRRKGGLLLLLGLGAVAGAVAAVLMGRRPTDDPWAAPATDPFDDPMNETAAAADDVATKADDATG